MEKTEPPAAAEAPKTADLAAEAAALLAQTEAEAIDRKTELARLGLIAAESKLREFLPLVERATLDAQAVVTILVERDQLTFTADGVFLIGADGAEVPATAEGLVAATEAISPALLRARGYSGSGGKQPRSVSGVGSVDLSRLSDRRYWKENKKAIVRRLQQEKA